MYFSHSLNNSPNNYLQDLGSEIALSIMVQEFTRLQNGTLSVTPVSIYISIYVSLLTPNLTSKGAGKLVTEMRDLGIHVHL